jgi:hypothetical protein
VFGRVIEAEVPYYDITERWHRTVFQIIGRKAKDGERNQTVPAAYQITSGFVYETDRMLLPVGGSPGAKEREAKERRRIKYRVKRMAASTRRWSAGLHSPDRSDE